MVPVREKARSDAEAAFEHTGNREESSPAAAEICTAPSTMAAIVPPTTAGRRSAAPVAPRSEIAQKSASGGIKPLRSARRSGMAPATSWQSGTDTQYAMTHRHQLDDRRALQMRPDRWGKRQHCFERTRHRGERKKKQMTPCRRSIPRSTGCRRPGRGSPRQATEQLFAQSPWRTSPKDYAQKEIERRYRLYGRASHGWARVEA